MPPINFTGLASGLDTKALIEAILDVERRPIERLQLREIDLNRERSAFDELRSKLNSLETVLRDLSLGSTLRGRTTSVSDESVLRATAGSGAETGLFDIEVSALAKAHKVKSVGLSAADQALVSDGTITIQSGSNDPITINVSASSGNNTLESVRDEINAADAGVSASVLFDGTDYRLIVRAVETGLDNQLAITDSTNLDLDDAANEVTAAGDATLTVDGIDVTSSTNRVAGVIPGVTLELLSTNPGAPATLEVKQDADGVVSAVESLVSAYNEVIDFFNRQDNRDNPGPLNGDFTLRTIQLKLQSQFAGGVEGIPVGGIRSLSAIGVDFDGKTGRATLDGGELRELLQTRFDEIGDLFLAAGAAGDPRIQYFASTSATQTGDYAVQITQAAERAFVVGSTAISSLKKDENLTITVGSDSTVVALAKNDDLATIIGKINTALDGAGIEAFASDDAGKLRISTDDIGSTADITVVSDQNDPGDGKQTGFDTTPASDTGEDVAGSIGGVAATGSGQLLTAAGGGPYEGLVLKVTATQADVVATGGDFGTVSFTRGLASSLITEIDAATRFDSGSIDVARERIDKNLEQIDDDVVRLEDRLASREAYLLRSFAAAEQAIAVLQAQQSSIGTFTLL